VKEHLKNVYGTLAMALGCAVLGVIFNAIMHFESLQFLFTLGIFGLMIGLLVFILFQTNYSYHIFVAIVGTDASPQNEQKRLAYMFGLD
jgi:uncharacterized membrane protein YjfL (UPF0719 family)